MSRRKGIVLSVALLFSGFASAEKIQCPDLLTMKNTSYRMDDVSLFQGTPDKLGELMPDTLNDMVWTLQDYQDYGREMNLPLYLVCRYKGTKKTVELKIPDTAKKCSAWFGNNQNQFYASCE
ncbi:STY0301 family protein [Citrobacter sp. BDA59-3]|uniref:STY0301 family protein n=1 Tax=Citrobacter sp. BDA59-3 TaxID=2781952 RepID=UPI0018814FC3|nr:STY0301 family protein [Citrobacter sp. BDA59-3]QOV69711.1 hypothetical protein IP582_04725 [Citrobacter sp. BDA59-3]